MFCQSKKPNLSVTIEDAADPTISVSIPLSLFKLRPTPNEFKTFYVNFSSLPPNGVSLVDFTVSLVMNSPTDGHRDRAVGTA